MFRYRYLPEALTWVTLGLNLMISNFLDNTNRMLKVGCSPIKEKGKVPCLCQSMHPSASQLEQCLANLIIPTAIATAPRSTQSPLHGRQVPGHCYSSTNLSDSVQSHLQGPFAARDVNEQGLQLHIASAEMFVQSTHVAKQATTWKGSSLSSLTDCISSLFDDCMGLLTQKFFQGEFLLAPSSTFCKDISPPLLQGMLRREPQR